MNRRAAHDDVNFIDTSAGPGTHAACALCTFWVEVAMDVLLIVLVAGCMAAYVLANRPH